MSRVLFCCLLFAAVAPAQSTPPPVPAKDAIRIQEFYRLESQISEKVWPGWAKTPAPLLLVTNDNEFLYRHPDPPKNFSKIGNDVYVRVRQFPTGLLATFPAFGPPSVIVIGEPENTEAKTSTPWVITLMHEHFHQLQDSQPDIFEAQSALGLAHGDETGMWMLNYPFPYNRPELVRSFGELRDRLLAALRETNKRKFQVLAGQYLDERKKFFSQLSAGDRKYLEFQLWKEGIARYVQVKSAEAAGTYRSSAEYASLADFESFESYGKRARAETLQELENTDLGKQKRIVVYSFGACEGFLLDRMRPSWKDGYFEHPFTLVPYFNP